MDTMTQITIVLGIIFAVGIVNMLTKRNEKRNNIVLDVNSVNTVLLLLIESLYEYYSKNKPENKNIRAVIYEDITKMIDKDTYRRVLGLTEIGFETYIAALISQYINTRNQLQEQLNNLNLFKRS